MPMESREPRSIRYTPAEWRLFTEAALLRDVEPSALVRECSLIGLTVLTTRALMEAYIRALSSRAEVTAVLSGAHVNGKARTP